MTETERITHRVMDRYEQMNEFAEAIEQYPHANLLMERPGMFQSAGECLRWTVRVLGVALLPWLIIGVAIYMLIAW